MGYEIASKGDLRLGLPHHQFIPLASTPTWRHFTTRLPVQKAVENSGAPIYSSNKGDRVMPLC